VRLLTTSPSHHVSQIEGPEPPRQPDRRVSAPLGEARDRQRRDAERRADCRREQARQEDVDDEPLGHVKGAQAAGEPAHQPGADERFKQIADGNGAGGRDRAGGREVGEEGPEKDPRPHARSQQEDRGQRQSRRRPHRGGVGVDKREREAALGGQEVADGQEQRRNRSDVKGFRSATDHLMARQSLACRVL